MELTQEQISQALIKIESHLKDIGIINNYSLVNITDVNDNNCIKAFNFQIANPNFQTIISIEYDFSKEENQLKDVPSFSWMDYKKITE